MRASRARSASTGEAPCPRRREAARWHAFWRSDMTGQQRLSPESWGPAGHGVTHLPYAYLSRSFPSESGRSVVGSSGASWRGLRLSRDTAQRPAAEPLPRYASGQRFRRIGARDPQQLGITTFRSLLRDRDHAACSPALRTPFIRDAEARGVAGIRLLVGTGCTSGARVGRAVSSVRH